MAFNPLDHPVMLLEPERLTDIMSWHEHIPFAFLLVDILRPKRFVELGVHKGDSYCAFCQAVDHLGLETRCHGVDAWLGDAHAKEYDGDAVLADLRAHHDPRHGRFSELMRMTFDEGASLFEANSIDILHIDGLHTYEAARHDYELWRPKMRENGVILFHDTEVREDDFGVYRLWEELKPTAPHVEFPRCNGLGVLYCGQSIPESLRLLFDPALPERAEMIATVERLGRGVGAMAKARARDDVLRERESRIERLEATIGRLEGHIAWLEEERGAFEAEVDALGQECDAKTTEIEAHQQELLAHQRELLAHQRELEAQFEKALEREAELGRLTAELQTIYNSRAWKALSRLGLAPKSPHET